VLVRTPPTNLPAWERRENQPHKRNWPTIDQDHRRLRAVLPPVLREVRATLKVPLKEIRTHLADEDHYLGDLVDVVAERALTERRFEVVQDKEIDKPAQVIKWEIFGRMLYLIVRPEHYANQHFTEVVYAVSSVEDYEKYKATGRWDGHTYGQPRPAQNSNNTPLTQRPFQNMPAIPGAPAPSPAAIAVVAVVPVPVPVPVQPAAPSQVVGAGRSAGSSVQGPATVAPAVVPPAVVVSPVAPIAPVAPVEVKSPMTPMINSVPVPVVIRPIATAAASPPAIDLEQVMATWKDAVVASRVAEQRAADIAVELAKLADVARRIAALEADQAAAQTEVANARRAVAAAMQAMTEAANAKPWSQPVAESNPGPAMVATATAR
jgi:hypothetical protein